LPTVLQYESVGRTQYFDVAGFPGRTVSMSEEHTAPPAADNVNRLME
jgi:hypothetical protein